MICSVLPCNADLLAAASSRMSWSLSLADSPAAQRLLQRVIEAGMGLFARHVPLANSKKSLQGSVLRSRSVISMPWREWEKPNEEQSSKGAKKASRVRI